VSASIPPAPPLRSAAPPAPPQLRAAIAAEVARSPGRRWSIQVRVALASLVPWAVTIVWCLGNLRRDMPQLPMGPVVLSTGATLLLALVALRIASTPAHGGLGARVEALAAVAVAAAPIYALATASAPLAAPGATPFAGDTGEMLRGAMTCAQYELGLSLLSFVALLIALRRSVPTAATARGAALGAAAGAWGGIALHLHCTSSDRMHLLIGHALPIGVLACVGALLAPRLLRT
jgi:hypothetical protein